MHQLATRPNHDIGIDRPALRTQANKRLHGIGIGLNDICRVARVHQGPMQRAMIWLHNFARLINMTADSLREELNLTGTEIRIALTDVNYNNQSTFIKHVENLRAEFESSLPDLVENRITHQVRLGILEAVEDRVFSEIIGPHRIGKSEPFLDEYLRKYMDCGIIFNCPAENDYRSFLHSMGQTMGVSVVATKRSNQLSVQMLDIFRTGGIKLIAIDEGQRLWPKDLTKNPLRMEYLRDAWDAGEMSRRARRGRDQGGGIGIAVCATPQFSDCMIEMLETNKRWKPGQLDGRMRRTHLPETLTESEMTAIAKFHAPEFTAPALRKVVNVALASPGLLGFLFNLIGKVRFMNRHEGFAINEDTVKEAGKRMLAGTAIEKAAKAEAEKKAKQLALAK